MLAAIILICAAGTAPADCTEAAALAVIRTPVLAALPGRCLMLGEAYLAGTALAQPGDVVRVACRPSRAPPG